jgi:transposase
VGRTIPSWRIIVEQEIVAMSRFKQFLGPEDRAVFDDLLNQCKLYAPQAGVLVSPVKEVPLLLSMIFAQHKKLAELQKRLNENQKWQSLLGLSL